MNSFSISKIARGLAIFTISLFVLEGCKKNENTIGSGFLERERFGSGIYRSTKVIAYTSEKESIITSSSYSNLLGVYKDPIFGSIKSSFGIQITLSEVEPDFGTDPIIDSVILIMPYLGRADTDSTKTYSTDSIYGNKDTAINIKISQLNKLLNPDSTYYSNIELPIIADGEIYPNTTFQFSSDSIALSYIDTTSTGADTTIVYKIPPSLRLKLENKYFQDNILDTDPGNLVSNANFISSHINGLVFETDSEDGAIYTFDMFNNTSLFIYYKNSDTDDEGEPLSPQSYELDFNNSFASVNKYDFNRSTAEPSLIAQLDPNYDTTQGSDVLYLQGMAGLESKIKLFTDQLQLDTLREEKWLINRAELVYRVSDENGDVVSPPFRLFMANSDSLKVATSDYRMSDYILEPDYFDGYLNSDITMLSDGTEKRYYKFRITNFVSAVLDGEIEMNESGDYEVVYDDELNYPIKLISFAGNASVSRVKLNGSNNEMDETKNLFLEIHYSKKD